jgi:hypothetical protein
MLVTYALQALGDTRDRIVPRHAFEARCRLRQRVSEAIRVTMDVERRNALGTCEAPSHRMLFIGREPKHFAVADVRDQSARRFTHTAEGADLAFHVSANRARR